MSLTSERLQSATAPRFAREQHFLEGPGEMSTRIQALVSAETANGALPWSPVLIAMVNLALASAQPTALYLGPEFRFFYNDAFCPILGVNHLETLGQPAAQVWAELWPELKQDFFLGLHQGRATVAERVLLPVERNGLRRDIYWNYTLTPILDEGRIIGLLNIAHDVTPEVTATNALVESDERLRLALSIGDCVGTWDWHIQPDLLYAEERFARLYGADTQRAAKGMPLADFLASIHPEDQPHVLKAIADSIASGEGYLAEYRLLQADASIRWVEARGRCIYAEDGQPQRFPGVTLDITRRKEAELAMAAAAPLAAGRLVAESLEELEPIRRDELIAKLQSLLNAADGEALPGYGDQSALASDVLLLLEEGVLLDRSFALSNPADSLLLTGAALHLEQQHASTQGLHLVQSGAVNQTVQRHMRQVLHAIWSVLGEVLHGMSKQGPADPD